MSDKAGHKVYFVMGVSGSGKTTVGSLLAQKLGIPFFDGDDFHPEQNIRKMESGIPLQDEDRLDWLNTLNNLAVSESSKSAVVIACSALKEDYRRLLMNGLTDRSVFIFLKGNFETIRNRMAGREGHFMPPKLLQSQFDTLEVPDYGIHVNETLTPQESVSFITQELHL
jgi:carbohydrate kinase (thermoresistant glucokinase family)